MARTKGSGWGGGPLLYQVCSKCGRKKAIYRHNTGEHGGGNLFKCTWKSCKKWFRSTELLKQSFA